VFRKTTKIYKKQQTTEYCWRFAVEMQQRVQCLLLISM